MAPSGDARPVWVYPILAVGITSFAFSSILVRLAGEAPGLSIAAWRTALTVLFMAPFALPRIGPEVRRFTRREVGLIILSGVLLGLHFVTWIESLFHTTVASSSVLVTTSPVFLAVIGFLALGERLERRHVAAVVLGVTGAVLIGLGDAAGSTAPRPLLGNLLALGAAGLVSLYMLIGRVVRRGTSWLAYVFPLYVVVSLTTLVAALARQVPLWGFPLSFYGWCALMALGPQLIGHGSINYALRYFPAALLGILTLLEPVGASALAYLLFGEAPGLLAVAGMGIVLSATVVTVLPDLLAGRRAVVTAGGTGRRAGR